MSKIRVFSAAVIAAAAVLGAGQATASALVVNGSFEDNTGFVGNGQDTMSLNVGSTTMTGWTVLTSAVAWIGPSNPFIVVASDGGYSLDLTDYQSGAPFGGITQNINTIAGHQYQLTFDQGGFEPQQALSIIQVDFGTANIFSLSTVTGPNFAWQSRSLLYTATGSSTSLSFQGNNGFSYIGLDNVAVTDLGRIGPGPIPEPATWAMMIVGFGAAGSMIRRRKAVVA